MPRATQVTRASEQPPAWPAALRPRLPGEVGANNQVAASSARSASSQSQHQRRKHCSTHASIP
eukprot:9366640-Pyramimonas_sp.AAC.1